MPMIDDDPISEYWEALRPPPEPKIDTKAVTFAPVLAWAKELGEPGKSPFLTLSASGLFDQLQQSLDGRYVSVDTDWVFPVSFFEKILRELVFAPELVVESSLQETVNRSAHLLFIHRMIWEARFLRQESPLRTDDYIRKWVQETVFTGFGQTIDTICFLTTLAAQNGLFQRTVLMCIAVTSITDRQEAKDFTAQLSVIRRWALLHGTSLGVLFGGRDPHGALGRLRKLNQTLSSEVEAGLAWTKKTRAPSKGLP